MDQSKLELQLQVWKDLAVNKQMMMSAAAEALGLDSECSVEELKHALDIAIKRGNDADSTIKSAKEKANAAVAQMKGELEESERNRTAAEASIAEAQEAQQKAEHQAAAGREANAKEVGKLKEQVADKEKALKAIKIALADTPENVVKKLKTLKKQKTDEANERKRSEAEVRRLSKEKQELDRRNTELQAILEDATTLAAQYRELYEQCVNQQEQLKSAGIKEEEIPALPAMDEALLDRVEQNESDKEGDDLAPAA